MGVHVFTNYNNISGHTVNSHLKLRGGEKGRGHFYIRKTDESFSFSKISAVYFVSFSFIEVHRISFKILLLKLTMFV